jgi:hypothetical protein
VSRYDKVLSEVVEEFPSFKVHHKDGSLLMRCLAKLLFFNGGFMGEFITTIGNSMWIPRGWEEQDDTAKAVVLRHERVHLRQQLRLGMTRYVLMYLFCPLPVLLSWGRMRLEREAFEETMRARAEYWGLEHLEEQDVRERFIRHFTTSEYGWMWPFRKSVDAWYSRVLDDIRSEYGA